MNFGLTLSAAAFRNFPSRMRSTANLCLVNLRSPRQKYLRIKFKELWGLLGQHSKSEFPTFREQLKQFMWLAVLAGSRKKFELFASNIGRCGHKAQSKMNELPSQGDPTKEQNEGIRLSRQLISELIANFENN